jgi:uncharacterized protein DUF5681
VSEHHANSDSPANRPATGKKTFDPSIGKETQFKPGQSGNPNGRPKKNWLTEATEELLEEKLSDPAERERWKNAQWEKMIKSGVVGAMFLDTAWERTEGKVAQPVRVSGELTVSLADEIRKARERAEAE